MGGKAALIVILGFSMVLLYFGLNNNDISNLSTRNYVNHFANETAHQIALSGANLAANRFFVDAGWEPSDDNIDDADVMGGNLEVTKTPEPGKPGRVRIVSTGRYLGLERRVTVVLQASTFGKYALFINSTGSVGYFPPATYFDGPIHINVPMVNGVPDPVQTFRVDGGTYKGKVTSDLMWTAAGGKNPPNFEGGFEDKVHVTLPGEFDEKLKNAVEVGEYDENGNLAKGFEFTPNRNVSLVFNPDGSITYKEYQLNDTSYNNSSKRCNPPADPTQAAAQGWITKRLDQLSPGNTFNGAMLIRNGNLRVKGTVDGKVTIGVLNSSNTKNSTISKTKLGYYENGRPIYFTANPQTQYGNVWFEDNVMYKDDPYTNPNSDDMLGIVSTNYIFAADNASNKDGIKTCGSYFSKYYGATTENLYNLPTMTTDYSTGKQTLVDWEYRGGWTEGEWQLTTLSNGKGYDQIYKYDQRLLKDSPPYFPATGSLSILSWLEE